MMTAELAHRPVNEANRPRRMAAGLVGTREPGILSSTARSSGGARRSSGRPITGMLTIDSTTDSAAHSRRAARVRYFRVASMRCTSQAPYARQRPIRNLLRCAGDQRYD